MHHATVVEVFTMRLGTDVLVDVTLEPADPDEFPEPGFAYERGVLAMANAGPGSTGSQFFIMLGEAPLPPQFSVFGEVAAGFETMDAIAALPLGPNSRGEVSVPLGSTQYAVSLES